MLLALLICLYVGVTLGLGLLAQRRVKNARDFMLAGQQLPLFMVVTTSFATWFASETLLGVPAKVLEGGSPRPSRTPMARASASCSSGCSSLPGSIACDS